MKRIHDLLARCEAVPSRANDEIRSFIASNTFPLFDGTEMYLRGDYLYNDNSYSTFNQDNSPTGEPYLPREEFDVVDFRAAVRWLDSDLEIAAFVQNVFNEHANFGPYQSIGVDFPGRPRLATNWPRTN